MKMWKGFLFTPFTKVDRQLVSGGINWAKSGRHFKLESCQTVDLTDDCYTWTEIDPKNW